jgi:hypothetical protein
MIFKKRSFINCLDFLFYQTDSWQRDGTPSRHHVLLTNSAYSADSIYAEKFVPLIHSLTKLVHLPGELAGVLSWSLVSLVKPFTP